MTGATSWSTVSTDVPTTCRLRVRWTWRIYPWKASSKFEERASRERPIGRLLQWPTAGSIGRRLISLRRDLRLAHKMIRKDSWKHIFGGLKHCDALASL